MRRTALALQAIGLTICLVFLGLSLSWAQPGAASSPLPHFSAPASVPVLFVAGDHDGDTDHGTDGECG